MLNVADLWVYVGLDYHNASIQVCVLDREGLVLGNGSVGNSVGEIYDYIERVAPGRLVKAVGVEACCGSSNLVEELRRVGMTANLSHAGVCAKMKQSPDKTDFSDARLQADLTRVGYLPIVWTPPEAVRDLRQLTRYRQQMTDERRRVKLRIRAMLRQERINPPQDVGNAWTKPWMKWLKTTTQLLPHSRWVMDCHLLNLEHLQTQVESIDTRLEEVTKDDELVKKLRSQKGVGLVTAVTMRAEIGDFGRFRCGKQLARYCAITPKNASSGKKQADGGLIRAGNLHLRTLLIETAHRLARYVPYWKAMKERLQAKGKPGSLVAAAIANRWVRRLYWEIQKPLEEEVAEA